MLVENPAGLVCLVSSNSYCFSDVVHEMARTYSILYLRRYNSRFHCMLYCNILVFALSLFSAVIGCCLLWPKSRYPDGQTVCPTLS